MGKIEKITALEGQDNHDSSSKLSAFQVFPSTQEWQDER